MGGVLHSELAGALCGVPGAPLLASPVEEYLVRQRCFAHLFEPRRDEAPPAEIQRAVDAYRAAVE